MLNSSFSFGQVDQNKKFGVSLNINSIGELPSSGLGNIHFDSKYLNGGDEKDKSFSLGINGNYYITKDLAIRVKAAVTKRKYLEYRDTRNDATADSQFARIDDLSISESDFFIAPGIYYQYRKDFFGIYGGFDIEYMHHSRTKLTDIVTNIDSTLPSENYIISSSITTPRGYSYGLGGFIGFNLFPTHFLSIGLEFSSALLHTKIGNTVYIEDVSLKGTYPNFDDSYRDSIDRTRFTDVRSSLNVSFWF